MSLLRLGEVEALYYYEGSWLNSLPATFNDPELVAVVLFHGYGANAADLSSIAEYYHRKNTANSNRKLLWIFPQGPLNLAGGYGDYGQRAWFPIPLERLMMQRAPGADYISQEVIDKGDHLLQNLESYFYLLNGLGLKKIVLGGFSQGGMIAYHLLPRIAQKFQINLLALFSTVSIDFNRFNPLWKSNFTYQNFKKLIQSHGTRDDILPYQEGKNLHSYISPFFQDAEFIEFNDGHTIPENVLSTFFKHL